MHPDKVKYLLTYDPSDLEMANKLIQKKGIDIPFGEHLIVGKQGKRIRGAISLYPTWRTLGRVVVGPIYSDHPIVFLRLIEAMESELTRMGMVSYYVFADVKDVKLQTLFENMGLTFVGKDNNEDSWYRRDMVHETIH